MASPTVNFDRSLPSTNEYSTVTAHQHVDNKISHIQEMQRPTNGLQNPSGGFSSQNMQIALLGDVNGKKEIADLCKQMGNQDQKHKQGISEIQGILDEFLKTQVVNSMRKQVEREIAAQIDDLVKESVAECLKDHIPQHLQDEIAESRRELEELDLALHNSESRRANGNLRSNKVDESLATLLMSDGNVSDRFPKDLKGLFSLDADTLKQLLEDYAITNVSNNRNYNLNRFMQFCGVRYQLVRRPEADRENH